MVTICEDCEELARDLEHVRADLVRAHKQLREWRARVRRLVRGVVEYGRHNDDCLLVQHESLPTAACTCGYINALLSGDVEDE